jgi:hypothetical protein
MKSKKTAAAPAAAAAASPIKRKTVRASNHPHMVFKSEHTTFTSHPEKGHPFGIRTVVSLANGKGTKRMETLGKNGKTLKSTSKSIKNDHYNEIKLGKYVPGLWGV